jgi:hypothetical protein
MKTRSLLVFAAIVAVTTVAGGWRDAPIPAPDGAALDMPARRNASRTPLTLEVHCTRGYWSLWCTATASGGTGTGYTFQWYGTYADDSQDASSDGYAWCEGDLYMTWVDTVGVQVTDSGGESTYLSGPGPCSYIQW